jgi:hypothetical protein
MKLFFKTSIVLVALIPLMQSCSRLSTVVDGTFSDKTKLVKEWRTYKGWNSICLSNGFIELYIVPQIGGRIIQYKLDDKEFFWVNPQLAGTLPPATGLDPNGNWLNYGGDKLWPAPQGWDNDQQWPGPPDAVLDGQPYNMEHLPTEKNGAVGVRLTSRNDPRSGVRFSRVIRLHPNETRVSIEATMTNVDNKPRRWGIWAHTQLDGGRSFRADVATGMMKVNYQYRVGKIGVDSHAGWVATVDGENGSAFIHRFTFESDKPYPDGSSVQFWLNGLGSIYAYNKNIEMPTTASDNPYVFESEVLSPFAQLDPGESYTYKYEWLSTKIGGDYAIVDCTGAGVVCEPMGAIWKEEKLHLTGRFGVFAPGRLRLSLFGKKGEKLLSHVIGEKVSPMKPVAMNLYIDSPAKPVDVILEWISKTGDRECVLGRTVVR